MTLAYASLIWSHRNVHATLKKIRRNRKIEYGKEKGGREKHKHGTQVNRKD
jgi:hypothetical protein